MHVHFVGVLSQAEVAGGLRYRFAVLICIHQHLAVYGDNVFGTGRIVLEKVPGTDQRIVFFEIYFLIFKHINNQLGIHVAMQLRLWL